MLSGTAIEKLGKRIASNTGPISEEDLTLLQEYRKSFKEPLANVFDELRKMATKVDSQCIVTYRIKRINTIIRKLKRFKDNTKGSMSLNTIGDIAGCRCIITSKDESAIYKIKDLLVKKYGEEIYSERHDYILNPKPDGYRSMHLYVKDSVTKRKVEIQIRTTRHHNWATLVEIVDVLFNTRIKEGDESNELRRFLYLFSKKENLDMLEKKELIKIEDSYKIYQKMCDLFAKNYLHIRKQWISRTKGGDFYVIEAGRDFKPTIDSYHNYIEAENAYYEKYVANRDSNIVLTYIPHAKFKQISTAYSNYILTVHSFFYDYKSFIEEQVLSNIQEKKGWKIWTSLKIYRKNVIIYIKTLQEELIELTKSYQDNSIKKNHKKEWEQDIIEEIKNWRNGTNTFIKKQLKAIEHNRLYFWLIRHQFKLLSKEINKQNKK